MKAKIIGILVVVVGMALALYVGAWLLFIGGIVGIAQNIDSGNITATVIAIGIIKMVAAGPVGYGIFIILGVIGSTIMALDD